MMTHRGDEPAYFINFNLKKLLITLLSYFLCKVMHYITFALFSRYFLNMSRAWLFVFNTISSIYSKCKSPFTPKSVMNKPQTEGRVNHVCTEVQHTSAIKNNEAQLFVYLKSFLLVSMAELDHQTLVDKMGLDTFVLFNIFNYCRLASYSEFTFHSFNYFWWILNQFFLQVGWINAHSHLV